MTNSSTLTPAAALRPKGAARIGWLKMLLRKELRLQRSNLMFGAGVLMLWVLVLGLSFFSRTQLAGFGANVGDLVQVANYFFLDPVLVLLLPMMVGATAVAQERKLGTLDWQMSLPASRTTQWALKCLAAGALAVFFGGIVAPALDFVLGLSLYHHGAVSTFYGASTRSQDIPLLHQLLRGVWPGVYALFAMALGSFASSLSRDPYRALMGAFGLLAAFGFAHLLADPLWLLMPVSFGIWPLAHPAIRMLLLLLLCVIILWVALASFRLQGFLKKRFAWQVAVLFAATLLLTRASLWKEFGVYPIRNSALPRVALNLPFASAKMQADVHELKTNQMSLLLGSLFSLDEFGMDSPNRPFMPNYLENTSPSALYRLPDGKHLLTQIKTRADILRSTGTPIPDQHLLKIDVQNGKVWQNASFMGEATAITPQGFIELRSLNTPLHAYGYLTPGNVLVLPGQPLERLLTWLFPYRPSSPNAPGSERPQDLDPQVMKSLNMRPESLVRPPYLSFLDENHNLAIRQYELRSASQNAKESTGTGQQAATALLRYVEQQKRYEIVRIDPGELWSNVRASRNGHWYALKRYSTEDLEICRNDQSLTHTLRAKGTTLVVANPGGHDKYNDSRLSPMGARSFHLSVSPDDGYLFFVRIHMIKAQDNGLELGDVPAAIDYCVLNLKNGTEQKLITTPPNERVMNELNTLFRARLKEYRDRLVQPQPGQETSRYWNDPEYFLTIPQSVWSKRNQLAILDANSLYLTELSPSGEAILPQGQKNIGVTGARDLDFFSEDTLLLWGDDSLWKLKWRI